MLNAFIAYPVLSFGIFKLLMARDMMDAAVKKYNSRRRNSRAAKDEVVDEKDEQEQLAETEKKKRWFTTTTAVYVKLQHVLTYEVALAICVAAWLCQSFIWGNIYLGAILGSTVIVAGLVYLQIMGLASRKSSSTLIQKLLRPAIYMFMAASLLVALSGVGLEAYCVSVFFLLWVMQVRKILGKF